MEVFRRELVSPRYKTTGVLLAEVKPSKLSLVT
jgi:hypothetical protein